MNKRQRFHFYTLIIDEQLKRIIIRERWKMKWTGNHMVSSRDPYFKWTANERRDYFIQCQNIVRSLWSNKISVRVAGPSKFAMRNADQDYKLVLDIRQVCANPHWNVEVFKTRPVDRLREFVFLPRRYIRLGFQSIEATNRIGPSDCSLQIQYTVAHEVGHTLFCPDEYYDEDKAIQSLHMDDQESILNIGMKVRKRHMKDIVRSLNYMDDRTLFYFP